MHVLFPHHREESADRISALDRSNLRIEEHGMPMHMAALALLAGPQWRDAAGKLSIQDIRRYVEERSRGVERLHQVLVWPTSGHQAPAWEDYPGFDITRHVLTRTLPPPGDEETLIRVCCDLTAAPLDRSRPLWELWFLDGLADGRAAVLLRLHHVVADGIAALELFSAMFDPAPDTPGAASPTEANQEHGSPDPSPAVLAGQETSAAARVKAVAADAAMRVRQLSAFARGGRAPALSWNRPVGPRRVHRLVRGDLAGARAVAHQQGGKVNDVVLAAVAGGAYRLLESRGELRHHLDMQVSVPASIRRVGEAGGNRVGIRIVPVPVSDQATANRLAIIAARTAAQRNRPPWQPNGRFMQRWMVHIMAHQRLINMVLSNMPGPPVPLWFAGVRVQEMFQISLLQGNCAIGVGVLSYAGQLNFDIVADPDIVPDVDVFAEGITETLEQLGARENAAL